MFFTGEVLRMAENLECKNVVKHLANGSLGKNFCLLCLAPLIENSYEDIFSLICKEDSCYCLADILEAVCQVKIGNTDDYNVCTDCFQSAISAYNFHLNAKKVLEMLSFYTEELLTSISKIELTDDDMGKLLCIPITSFIPVTTQSSYIDKIPNGEQEEKNVYSKENKIILVVENDKTSYHELDVNDTLKPLPHEDNEEILIANSNNQKVRKKSDPRMYISCTRCRVKYKMFAKLKEHVKSIHNAEIYFCKICKIATENKEMYESHVKTHRDKHQCTICNAIYKKAKTLEIHMKMHEYNTVLQTDSKNICEVCGAILPDEYSLEKHMNDKHLKRFTCYYCGKMYKTEISFDIHIKKHELHLAKSGKKLDMNKKEHENKPAYKQNSTRLICPTCGKDFVDERALMWHQRLHNNDRPFVCEVCGRGFVSAARRNHHVVCSHSRPARRCPLCPAAFHCRSMVNTHLKKVHLTTNKLRKRKVTRPDSGALPVPLPELSVDVQTRLLDITAGPDSAPKQYFDQTQAGCS